MTASCLTRYDDERAPFVAANHDKLLRLADRFVGQQALQVVDP
jgi:hypothetical protein